MVEIIADSFILKIIIIWHVKRSMMITWLGYETATFYSNSFSLAVAYELHIVGAFRGPLDRLDVSSAVSTYGLCMSCDIHERIKQRGGGGGKKYKIFH